MLNKLTSEELSYIVGLFQGDGSMSETTRNRGKFIYEISVKDADIVRKLDSMLGSLTTVKISTRTRDTNFKDKYESITLIIYQKAFRDSLNKYMPYSKKSTTVSFHQDLDIRHYIRGLTDADGSMGIADTRCFWSLCTSSEAVKDTVLSNIKDVIGADKKLSRNSRDNVYNIVLYNEDAQKYAAYLYEDSSISINRKFNAFNIVQRWVRTTIKRAGRPKKWEPYEDKVVLSLTLTLAEKIKLLNRTSSSIKTREWRLAKHQNIKGYQ